MDKTRQDETGEDWRGLERTFAPTQASDCQGGCRRFKSLQPFSTVFDILLEKRIVRPGFELKCTTCSKGEWYHISEFAEEFTCRFCFTSQRVSFGSKKEWQYKADGLFQIKDSAQGSVAVILSLWRFEHLGSMHYGRYLTSQDVIVKDTGRRLELDYAYVIMDSFESTYDLVLGQANRLGDFSDDDMRNMADLADRFRRKPYLAFSTLKETYSDEDKARFRELCRRGYRIVALTREELDPYDLHERFTKAPHRYATELSDLAENTVSLNVA